MKYIQTILLGLILITSFYQCSEKTNPVPSTSPNEIFSAVWNDFDENYPYFIHKKIDWDSVYQVYHSEVSDDISSNRLAEVIGEMTLVLKDIHVNFVANKNYYHYRKRENYPENPGTNATNYLSNIVIDNSVAIYGDISNTNIAYLRLKTFTGSSGSYNQIANQLDSLLNRDGLIIDIRDNPGGNELNGRTIAGKFTQDETLYRYVRTRNGAEWDDFTNWNPSYFSPNKSISYDEDIILLTNRGVYSSAELFVLMMKTYPNLTIIGDTTGGATANPEEKKLANGWRYHISRWQAAGLDYALIEDNGIAPDQYILMESISIAEGKDLILEKAIEQLQTRKQF